MNLKIKNIIGGLIGTFLFSGAINAQTTATDFSAADCNGINHQLFNELDAGKIVVIAWVMPCGSCAPPALAAYNAVQTYASTHPDKVVFYMVDDYGNNTCNTLNGWANVNAMGGATTFSNATISMSDYGTDGMPKIVVLGGTSHKIEYNQNSGVTQKDVGDAIALLIAEEEVQSVEKTNLPSFQSYIAPNPSTGNIKAMYALSKEENVTLQLVSAIGAVIHTEELGNLTAGQHYYEYNDCENLMEGNYFLKIKTSTGEESIQFYLKK